MDKKIGLGAGITIIAVVGLVVVGLVWWNSSNQPAAKQTTTPLASEATQSTNTTAQTQGGTVYTNQQYGFQLTFPTGWEKYTTEVLSKPSDVVATIAFNLPTSDPEWIKSGSKTNMVFSLSIIPISKFATEEAKCEKELGKSSDMCFTTSRKVGQNNQYAFYYLRADKSTDYPKDFSVTLFNQVDDIIKTFKAVDKKYTNQAYGYSFDYPVSWTIDTSDPLNITLNSPESQKLIDEAKKKGPGEILDQVVVSYYVNYSKFKKENPLETESFEGTPVGDDLDSWINVSKDLDKSILNVEKINFAGGKAWFYGRIGGFAGEPYAIALSEHNNHIYKIVFAREKKGLLSDEKKIISSFSFQ